MKAMIELIGHSDDELSTVASEALVRMGLKNGRDKIIGAVTKLVKSNSASVREGACKTLSMMDKNAATEEVILALVEALEDYNERVRATAGDALLD
ncbi:unnamed protein product, partial [Rotaria magnacalcarata]